MISDLEVKNIFCCLEEDIEIYKYTIKGTYLYDLLRFNLEIDFRYQHEYNKTNWKYNYNKLREILSRYKSKIFHLVGNDNKIFSNEGVSYENIIPSKFLFVSTSSWTRKPSESLELYDIIKYYHSRDEVISFVQPNYFNNILKQPYHNNFFSIDLNQIELSENEQKEVSDFITYVSSKLKMDFSRNIRNYQNCIASIFYLTEELVKIIKVTKPKFVFSRSLYTEKWVVLACKLMDVKCIEVQHGVVGANNIYYQSINKEFLLPDIILTMGDEWTNILLKSTSKYTRNNVFTLGYKIKKEIKNHNQKSSAQILFCLQHGIFQVNDLIIKFFNKYGKLLEFNNISITLRPHPNALEPTLKMFERFSSINIEIQNSKQINLNAVIQNYDGIISPSSMCLYESLSYGIPAASFEKFKGTTISEGLNYLTDENSIWNFISDVKNKKISVPRIEYLSDFDERVLDNLLRYDHHH